MTVYVDDLKDYGFTDWRKGRWAHMWSDDLEELHRMARVIGLRREWFQNGNLRFPHYDLRPNKHAYALRMGARDEFHTLGEWIKYTKEGQEHE